MNWRYLRDIERVKKDTSVLYSSIKCDPSGCWLWTGSVSQEGYAKYSKVYVHRIMYEEFKGTIPEELEIDHRCRVKHCVNPMHLEAVTTQENQLRGGKSYRITQECSNGHDLTVPRTLRWSGGRWYCHLCTRDRTRRWREGMR